MNQLTPRVLNYFALFSFKDPYWLLNENAKGAFHEHWMQGLGTAATNFDIYQNADSDADLLVWCGLNALQPSTTSQFLERFAVSTAPFRHLVRPVDSMWGFTRPSPDAKARSPQELDPLSTTRLQYLMVYPFGSGPEWYSMDGTARQKMMDKCAEVGNRYDEVKRLVLHSAGLQGQEFILLYETDDLDRFADLAAELRDIEAGRFMRWDRPAYTGIYHPAADTLGLWK